MSNYCNSGCGRGVKVMYDNTTNCKRVCKKKVTCKDIRDQIYKLYLNSGILVRGNDGQQPYTIKQIGDIIKEDSDDPDNPSFNFNFAKYLSGEANLFGGILGNLSPPFSASLLSGVNNNLPVAWYDNGYVEAFPTRKNNDTQGHRTLFSVIFKNERINIKGGCLFDADSNLRNLGNIPPVDKQDKAVPGSLWSNTLPFQGIGNFTYSAPSSNNNNPEINPLFKPRTDTGVAKSSLEVNQFLYEIAYLKQIFIEKLLNSGDDDFKDIINGDLSSGVEPEILVKPRGDKNYYSQKFNPTDILAFAVICDSDAQTLNDDVPNLNDTITESISSFIEGATGDNGWIYPTNNNYLKKLPVVGIFNVALPDLNLDATGPSPTKVGTSWLEYIDDGFNSRLQKSDFLCRDEFVI